PGQKTGKPTNMEAWNPPRLLKSRRVAELLPRTGPSGRIRPRVRYYDLFTIPDRPSRSSTIMTTATQLPPHPEIEYPDSDGKPMSDHDLQYKWIVVIKEGLEIQFDDEPNVYGAGNLLWYPVEGEPTIRGAPDILVACGRPKRLRGSYKQW